ncbi:MAG: translocation/assembly module TamB domain-containing protein [Elusimicrobiota bacterium]|nr:translocation/assembly module TamB domain-containing protein [Elusimicrobiota bacterium]
MKRAPLAVKLVLAAAAVAAAGLAAATLLLLLKPGLLINSRTAAYVLTHRAKQWEPRWRVLNLKAWAPSLREKELTLTASDLCFRHAETGSDGCLNVVDIHVAVSVWPPRLLRADRFIVGSNRLRIISSAEPGAGGPAGIPAPLLGAKLGLIRVELEKLELRSGARAVAGSVKASFDAGRTRPLAVLAELAVDGRPLRVEAAADTGVFPSGGLRTLDALWSGSFAGSGAASGVFKASRKEDGGELEVSASGLWTASSSTAPVRSVRLRACRGTARAPESFQADCSVIVTPGRAAPVREIRGLASVRGRFSEKDHMDVEAGLDLEPVRDWYEVSGRLRMRVEGELGRLAKARLTHELAVRLKVPRFEELAGRLEGTGLELPAALRPFRGPVELELEGSGDPRRRDHRFTLRGRSRLADGAQKLAVSLTGALDVRDPLLPERSARAEGKVAFDDIALALPRLDGGGASSTAAIVARIHGRADVTAVLPRDDEFTARAAVDLGPVKDWYEASGRLRLSAAGRLTRLRDSRVEQDFEARLAVPRFADLVARLRDTAWAVPAPLHVLKGSVEATARGSGDPRRGEQRVRLTANTRLAEGRQRLSLSADADITVREALLPSRTAEAKASVVLEDVALELPRLEIGAPPDMTLDKRIAPAAEEPAQPGPRRKAWFKYEAKVATAKPALLLTNLAKEPIPVGLGLAVSSEPPRLSGRIWLERFETALFGRIATIERFGLTPLPGGLFELDGLVLVRSAEAVVRILVLGTSARPRVDLSSDPPLDRQQIFALLLFNKVPDELDAGQSESVGHAQGAVASNAFGLASLYLFASTPIEYVGYDPSARTASLRLRVPGGATVELGASQDETKHVRLRKRLAAHWALQTEVRTREREGNIVTTFLEWYNRF